MLLPRCSIAMSGNPNIRPPADRVFAEDQAAGDEKRLRTQAILLILLCGARMAALVATSVWGRMTAQHKWHE